MREVTPQLPQDAQALAKMVKSLSITTLKPRPMDEAISTAGGIPWNRLDAGLMLLDRPGIFCAGEMIDWEAPTGGYLITACLATGRWAVARRAICAVYVITSDLRQGGGTLERITFAQAFCIGFECLIL